MHVSLRAGRVFLILYLTLFLGTGAFAYPAPPPQEKKLNIAVLDFDARGGISKEEAATLSDAFQAELAGMNDFILVDRARIRQILEEQGFQQSEACSQVECIVEAGKILNVQRMFAGVIGKVGELFNVNIQTIDIATAQIVSNRSRQHEGRIEELLSDIIPDMAKQMAADLLGREYEPEGGGGWIWWVLGTVVVGGGGAAAAMFLLNKKDAPGETITPATELPASPDFPS
jgi:hypothetical protein